ncbi:MAG: ABC transporter permease, partial [Acidobacteria bacterium]|nr:ABC transporter permease [Acidobacteriota bacterium]
MSAYLALIQIDLKLASRDRMVIFFNYLFPLIFFFVFAEMMDSPGPGGMANIVTMVLAMGVLGNGLWGAGMRLVQEREQNILRRYKVTPISPLPILVASMVTGWLIYIPAVLLTFGLARLLYKMPIPAQWPSLLVMVTVGVLAFRAIGLIIASVVNSVQESTIVIQLFYMPMLFLSGTTIPVAMLPSWAQIVGQYLPASYLITGFQGMFLKGESLSQNRVPVLAMLVTVALGAFISMQIFRWEKGEKLAGRAKFWVLAVLSPFVILGTYQAYSKEHIEKAGMLWRELQRSESVLIRGARIFVGDGPVIESGAVLLRGGKIEGVYSDFGPDPAKLQAEVVEASGKTLLPGLIDVHVHLGAPGGFYADMKDYNAKKAMERELAAYLYSGVTAVKSVGDWQNDSFALRDRIAAGHRLGAELFVCGPMFTTAGGHGTEYVEYMPEMLKAAAREQLVRTPKTAAEARQQVRALKQARADGLKAILEAGRAGMLFERMDAAVLQAVAGEARAQKLPLVVHTGGVRDIEDALNAGAVGIEHGSFSDSIPGALLARMAKEGVAYDPTLTVIHAMSRSLAEQKELLNRSLVQQVGPPKLLEGTRQRLKDRDVSAARAAYERACENLRQAHRAGVRLVTGSDAGNAARSRGARRRRPRPPPPRRRHAVSAHARLRHG